MIFTGGFIPREEKSPWSFAEEVYVLPKVSLQPLRASRGGTSPVEEFTASLGGVFLKDWKGPTLFLVKIRPIPLMLNVVWRFPTDIGNVNF